MFVEELVLGNTLEAQLYCFLRKGSRLVPNRFIRVFPYETTNFSLFGSDKKEKIYNRLLFMNSLRGKLLFSGIPNKITLTENECILIEGGEKHQIEFARCKIFDAYNITLKDLVHLPTEIEKCRVVDLFKIGNVKKNYDFGEIKTEEELVTSIWPHNSGRVAGSKYVTDFYTESWIRPSDIQNFDFSETMAKFKLFRDLKSAGYLGTIDSTQPCGSKKYSNFILEHMERYVVPLPEECSSSRMVEFVSLSLEEIFNEKEK